MLAMSVFLVASCDLGGAKPYPTLAPAPTQASTSTHGSGPTATPAPTQGQSQSSTSAPTPTGPAVPSAPANVGTSSSQPWGVECRPEDEGGTCWLDLHWTNTSGPGTRFRIYEAWTGEEASGTPTCGSVQDEVRPLYDTPPDMTSIYLEVEMVIGNGAPCYWVSAFNAAGESALSPSAANYEGD